MAKIKLTDIKWGKRGREDYGDVTSLSSSLQTHGLIEPIVLDESYTLIAGGRRLSAAILLNWDEIDYHSRGELTARQLKELELEENVQRKDLTWQEKASMTSDIDALKREENPNWRAADTAEITKSSEATVSKDLMLMTIAKECPDILKVKERKAALTMARRFKDAQIRSVIALDSITPKEAVLHLGDARDILKSIPSDSIDLVLLDPPYGVNVDRKEKTPMGSWRDGWNTMYDDSTQNAILLMDDLLAEVKRVLKPGAHCYLFFGLQLELDTMSIRSTIEQHLNFQRCPLMWVKNTHSNKDPYQRFGLNYEPFYFCWKGATPRDLLKARQSTFSIPVNTRIKQHPSEKPEQLYRELIEISTHPGETILDPTAGSGISIATAISLGRKAIGIEIDPMWHDLIKVNVAGSVPSLPAKDGTITEEMGPEEDYE